MVPKLNLANLTNLQLGPGHIGIEQGHILSLLNMANCSQQSNFCLYLQLNSNVPELSQHPIFQKVTTLELGHGKNHLIRVNIHTYNCVHGRLHRR
jgi:hypothetical protein